MPATIAKTADVASTVTPRQRVDTTARRHPRKRGSKSKWLKRGVWIAIGTGLAVLLVLAWLPKPIVVDTHVVRRGPMQITVDDSGRTRVKDRHVVSAPITGTVSRIDLRPNDVLDRNGIVARIAPVLPNLLDPRTKAEVSARLAAATAAAKQARTSLERARLAAEKAGLDLQESEGLAKAGAISAHALEQAQFERRLRAEELSSAEFANQVAEHEIEVVRATLQRTSAGQNDEFPVTSPARGRVLRVLRESAGVVQAGTPLVEIGDPAALEIVSDVLTSDAVHIGSGARVIIERWGGDGPLSGHVRYVEPSAFTRLSALGIEEQRVNVVIELDDPRDKWAALGDGYRVETRIVIWQSADVLSLPSSAAFRHGDGWAVFVEENGVARRRAVEVAHRNDSDFEIAAGVDEGAVVVIHPSERVKDGERIRRR